MSAETAGAPLDELPLNEKKQQFSLAFVQMVVAAAGCSVKSHGTDYDGVDITIASSAEYEDFYCPQFELQLKCTSQDDLLREDHLSWTMKAGPFRRLTNPKRYIPAYLGILLVPGDPDGWLDQDENQLFTRSRMYWQSAADLGMIADTRDSKTVHLPRSNLFDVPQLLGIMKTIGEGGHW
jgi:hypothetical protein